MKRLTLLLLTALLALAPTVVLPTDSHPAPCYATASAKNKHKKQKKSRQRKKSNIKQHQSAKKQTLTAVPRISTLTGTTSGNNSATGGESTLLTVTMPAGVQRIDYKAITIYFNRSLRIPICVAYELTATMVSMADAPEAEKRRNHNFHQDTNVAGCPHWGDYRGSGYSRGHMAPAMDMRWDRQAMNECFAMTNICPQDEKLNNGPWRILEERVHRWARRDGSILVFTGPIMTGSTRRIGPKGDIAVPAAFYKVLYAPGQQRAIAFIYDNDSCKGSLAKHATTISEVERRTGITFFPRMAAAAARPIKRQCDLSQWQ